jgi:hypothetical protein
MCTCIEGSQNRIYIVLELFLQERDIQLRRECLGVRLVLNEYEVLMGMKVEGLILLDREVVATRCVHVLKVAKIGYI